VLNRKVVEEFLLEEMEAKIIPRIIDRKELVEAFCQFAEADYYEWLKDNFNSFFNHGNPDWGWIEKYVHERKHGTPER
jgi:hypothetical protein